MSSAESGETLAGLGEFAVIGRITARRTQPAEVVVGPGDDAALLTAADGRVVVSTDMLVEGRHFRLDWSTPHDVGRKAIAQNAADIEAMGGRAYAFVVGFGAPAHTEAADAQRLSDGMWSEATKFGAGIVGGDLVAAPQWVVSVTVLGDLGGRQPVLLSGAQPGDTVAVIGDLGWSGAGYALWRKGIHEFDELRRRHLVPHVRYGQGAAAAVAGATALTDVSDGLVADLGHIASASGVAFDLSVAALEADVAALRPAAAMVGGDARDWVLGGGEDHVLVGTFGGALPAGWRAIGTVGSGEPRVTVDGASWHGAGGWESFGQ
ncbi:MAG: thiamine-phosphate kinase [Mycobacterium sp.]|nr:MAG: thiamine-phosphate kinase [Mycobacterium sp.]